MSRKKRKNNTINNLYHTPIVDIFTKHPYQYFNYKQIAAKLQVHGKEERHQLRNHRAITDSKHAG